MKKPLIEEPFQSIEERNAWLDERIEVAREQWREYSRRHAELEPFFKRARGKNRERIKKELRELARKADTNLRMIIPLHDKKKKPDL